MQELVSIILIGISLSMDTFSLSLSTASIFKDNIYLKILPIMVGIFHFLMPFFGTLLGLKIIKYLNMTSNLMLGIILIILGVHLLIELLKDRQVEIKLNLIGTLSFAFSVSIDSFSIGLGMTNLTNNYFLAFFLFAILSFSFTMLGLLIGRYASKKMGMYATLLGVLILLILGIYHLFI